MQFLLPKLSSSVIATRSSGRTCMGWHVFHYLRANARHAIFAFIIIFLFFFWLKFNSPATFVISFGSEKINLKLPEKAIQTTTELCPVISPKLIGWTNLSSETITTFLKENENDVESKLKAAGVKTGGMFEPSDCQSRHKVAIIVPFRNRTEHLTVFLRYMHPFLQRQQLSYIIIVVEQSERSAFNRGMLMNIGFTEAQLLQEKFQCFILHDVDMLPEHDGNPYTCPEDGKPRQMAFAIDYWGNYSPVAWSFFGAVSAISTRDFQASNGYSNSFWGWGGEDDQLYHRVRAANLTVVRPFDGQSLPQVHYRMLSHQRATPNPERKQVLKDGWNQFKTDGLTNLKYKRIELKLKPLYTHVIVDIQP